MKLLSILAVLGFSLSANAQSVDAPGKVFYVMPTTGEVVYRDVTLEVPSRGQGKVYMKNGEKKFAAEKFFSKKVKGRTLFYVIFKGGEGQPFQGTVVYRGTYVRGSNQALYYGDIFKAKADGDANDMSSMKGFTYSGGFYFKSKIGR